jgi:hypothetical protein
MITEQDLGAVLNRARNLMGPEGDAKINSAAQRNAGNFTANADGDITFSQPSASKGMGAMKQMPNMGGNLAGANLPKAIRESIIGHPIDVTSTQTGGSVLDNLDLGPVQSQKQAVYEQQYTAPQQPTYYQPQYVPQPAPMTIDYNYIRAIVNECIQANMEKIKEEILNESSLKLVKLNGGNKIQLVDNKNNLYESTLTFKKNLNKG